MWAGACSTGCRSALSTAGIWCWPSSTWWRRVAPRESPRPSSSSPASPLSPPASTSSSTSPPSWPASWPGPRSAAWSVLPPGRARHPRPRPGTSSTSSRPRPPPRRARGRASEHPLHWPGSEREVQVEFAFSPKVEDYRERLNAFMDSHVFPAEAVYREQMEAAGDPDFHPPIVEDLKTEARSRGLWNLFLPAESGLSVLEYAPLAEITGRSPELAPEALHCAAPDTGNMEILHMFGTDEQKERWLAPLLDGEIRSCFSMTEPAVASSDATNISTRIERDGDEYVINGRKWFSSGAASERCKISIVMGVTNPDNDRHHQQSMVLVPMDT